jgi:hypothetical protein
MRKFASTKGIAILLFLGCVREAAADIAMPVVLSGWNADVVTDANPGTRSAQQFDFGSITGGLSAWYEKGILFNGSPLTNGLPSGQNFNSLINNSVTGTPTVFHLLPADGNNVLRTSTGLGVPSGTLTLTTPAQYSSLAFLASTGAAFGFGTGTLTLHFSGGTSSGPFSYDAPDWNMIVGNDTSHVALGPVGRNDDINFNGAPPGTGFLYTPSEGSQFVMYETDLNLAALGLDTKILDSITFTSATNAPDPFGITGVFAVSGVPAAAVPEPSSLALLALGGGALAGWRRWRRRRVV